MGEIAIAGGIELVKFLVILALQEARRSGMTPEQVNDAFLLAKAQFEASNPDQIPDV